MSEYQYVVFQAVDGPLDDRQLEFARQQSTRADVSRWSLAVEYHYSSFQGDVDGLLRRGFDVYLQFTSYGSREIKLRLPRGMPVAKRVWAKYLDGMGLDWTRDDRGRGGILSLRPFGEMSDYTVIQEPQRYLDAAIQMRDRLMSGDLRALYLAWLCAASDGDGDPEELIEPPVPHGIADAVTYGADLLSFFELDPLLIRAAGAGVNAAPAEQAQHRAAQWVDALDESTAKDWLLRLLNEESARERARLLATIRDSQRALDWPTSDLKRSVHDLLEQTSILRAKEDAKEARKAEAKAKRAAAKAERHRAERMQEMRNTPETWLRQAERLVDARGTDNYREAADILHDLREALGGTKGDRIARQHAARLAKKHPTLNVLKSSLRKRGLLD